MKIKYTDFILEDVKLDSNLSKSREKYNKPTSSSNIDTTTNSGATTSTTSTTSTTIPVSTTKSGVSTDTNISVPITNSGTTTSTTTTIINTPDEKSIDNFDDSTAKNIKSSIDNFWTNRVFTNRNLQFTKDSISELKTKSKQQKYKDKNYKDKTYYDIINSKLIELRLKYQEILNTDVKVGDYYFYTTNISYTIKNKEDEKIKISYYPVKIIKHENKKPVYAEFLVGDNDSYKNSINKIHDEYLKTHKKSTLQFNQFVVSPDDFSSMSKIKIGNIYMYDNKNVRISEISESGIKASVNDSSKKIIDIDLTKLIKIKSTK